MSKFDLKVQLSTAFRKNFGFWSQIMLSLLLRLIVVLLIFGGGFYSGVQFAEHQYVKDPSKLTDLMKKSVKDTATKQLEKAKELLEKE